MKDLVALYQQYEQPLYRFLLALTCGDEAMAEELVQETFYQAFLHIDQFEGRSQLLTWLCQIGKNAWLKECRRKNRYSNTPPEELPLVDLSHSPEDEVMKNRKSVRFCKPWSSWKNHTGRFLCFMSSESGNSGTLPLCIGKVKAGRG